MGNSTVRNAAETLGRVLRPQDRHTVSLDKLRYALTWLDGQTIDRMCLEVGSLFEAGYHQQAAERLHTFLYPKFRSATEAHRAYDAAMVGKRGRAA